MGAQANIEAGRRRDIEAGLAETIHQHIAALLVDVAHFGNVGAIAIQRGGCGHLNGGKRAVVEVGFSRG